MCDCEPTVRPKRSSFTLFAITPRTFHWSTADNDAAAVISIRYRACANAMKPAFFTIEGRVRRLPAFILSATAFALKASWALAQTAPPSYQSNPDVYKVIYEDQNFRVIAVTRKKGLHDKAHGHPVPSIVYNITDCATKLYATDGKTNEVPGKAGTANAVAPVASHSAENISPVDSRCSAALAAEMFAFNAAAITPITDVLRGGRPRRG
jgi:hypothetical protein